MDTEFAGEWRKAPFQGADNACRDTGGMPVHPHHRAERLEPERVSQAAQQFSATIVMDDRLAHHRAKARHAITEPFGHATAMQWEISTSRSLRQFLPPALLVD
jgi:hypothetical protein